MLTYVMLFCAGKSPPSGHVLRSARVMLTYAIRYRALCRRWYRALLGFYAIDVYGIVCSIPVHYAVSCYARLLRYITIRSAMRRFCRTGVWHPTLLRHTTAPCAVQTALSCYAFATQCPVLTCGMLLRAPYAMSGTPYAMSGTDMGFRGLGHPFRPKRARARTHFRQGLKSFAPPLKNSGPAPEMRRTI
eukprot:134136-Rhodomonas_salina.1